MNVDDYVTTTNTTTNTTTTTTTTTSTYSSENMFNRKREFTCLMHTLRSTPQLNVITVPVNSGKTLLVEKVLPYLEADNFKKKTPIYLINFQFDSTFLLLLDCSGDK